STSLVPSIFSASLNTKICFKPSLGNPATNLAPASLLLPTSSICIFVVLTCASLNAITVAIIVFSTTLVPAILAPLEQPTIGVLGYLSFNSLIILTCSNSKSVAEKTSTNDGLTSFAKLPEITFQPSFGCHNNCSSCISA